MRLGKLNFYYALNFVILIDMAISRMLSNFRMNKCNERLCIAHIFTINSQRLNTPLCNIIVERLRNTVKSLSNELVEGR